MKTSKRTLTRLRSEITNFFGEMVNFRHQNVEVYDTSPEISAFVYIAPKNFKGNLNSEFLGRLMEMQFYARYKVSKFAFGFSDRTNNLVIELSLKAPEMK